MTPRISPRRRRFLAQLEEARPFILERAGRWCEARTPRCIGVVQHLHHRRGRVRRDANEPEHLLAVCLPCHAYIHHHPAESYARGWLLRRHDV